MKRITGRLTLMLMKSIAFYGRMRARISRIGYREAVLYRWALRPIGAFIARHVAEEQ